MYLLTSTVIVALNAYCAQITQAKLNAPRNSDAGLQAKKTHITEAEAKIALNPHTPSQTSGNSSNGNRATPIKKFILHLQEKDVLDL